MCGNILFFVIFLTNFVLVLLCKQEFCQIFLQDFVCLWHGCKIIFFGYEIFKKKSRSWHFTTLSDMYNRTSGLIFSTYHLSSNQLSTRENMVYFPQCIASNGIYFVQIMWGDSGEIYLNKLTEIILIFILGIFHHYCATWPPVQNISLEAMHCGKCSISSLTVCNRLFHFKYIHLWRTRGYCLNLQHMHQVQIISI